MLGIIISEIKSTSSGFPVAPIEKLCRKIDKGETGIFKREKVIEFNFLKHIDQLKINWKFLILH